MRCMPSWTMVMFWLSWRVISTFPTLQASTGVGKRARPSWAIRIPHDVADLMDTEAGNGAPSYHGILPVQKRTRGFVWNLDKDPRPAAPNLPRTIKPIPKWNLGNLLTDPAFRLGPFCPEILFRHLRLRR